MTDFLAHLEHDIARLADVVRRSPLDAHVPTYPAFTTETLAAHVGRGLRLFHRLLEPDAPAEPSSVADAPAGIAVADWIEAELPRLLDAFARIRRDQTVVLPSGPIAATALPLVAATEVGIHRWDIESVLDDHDPIASDLAVAILDSVFDRWTGRLEAQGGAAPIGGAVLLSATDTPDRWRIEVRDSRVVARRGELDGEVAGADLRAPMQTLLLVVWKRLPVHAPTVEVRGDAEIVRRLLAIDYVPDPRTNPAH